MDKKVGAILFITTFGLCEIINIVNSSDILDKTSKSSDNVYHGRYTRDVKSPELLVPRIVNKDGSFSTFLLSNFYDRVEVNERRKRSENPDIDKLHIVLPFESIDHHVELTPYHDFISPEMVIETRGDGDDLNERLRFKRVSDQQCHYRGFVRDHDNSKAVLSLCDGVAGFIHTNNGRYFIEPMSESSPGRDGRHIHMVYKRRAPHEKEDLKSRCGTGDNWESAWAEQLAERERRLIENTDLTTLKREDDAKISSFTHSIHRFIEIGLVADKKFLDYHKNNDYEKYLLTIMNIVSDLYHDNSVGNQIDIVVVRIIYLEKEEKEMDLSISPNSDATLDSFASWAFKMNPPDHNHPNHFDIAVLVTRHDICSKGSGCTLLGLAFMATACNPKEAAAINEDNGLILGVVIAHEVGHVMGCPHDEAAISGCPPQLQDESFHVMSPIVNVYTFQWSTCSKGFIKTLLESGLGECLNDDPRNPPEKFKYPSMLPGAMYDADFQCDLAHPGKKLCSGEVNCASLWCQDGKKCVTNNSPPAEGTKCAENKWCIKKQCVQMGSRPQAINGGWSEWGKVGACSTTCGGGIKFAERECNNPAPLNGGKFCVGERKRLETCNTTPCDPSKPNFRAVQCSKFDSQYVLKDKLLHTWAPIYRKDLDPCSLYCVNEKNVFVKLENIAKDSTPCKAGTNYMCISGACRKVGCDWVIDSDAIPDKCGVCNGDGTHCRPINGEYDEKPHEAYTKIVTIPMGARHIFVTEKIPSENSFAIKLEKSGTYCLNANFHEEVPGEYPCAGATLMYSKPQDPREEISIKEPINESIVLEYVFFNPNDNPGIKYQYYVMNNGKSNYTPKYSWEFTEWTPCDVKCGGGTMVSEATCIEQQNGVVSPSFCQDIPKLETKTRICNENPCPAKWRVSKWSKCNSCDNKNGIRRRKVHCVKPAARPGGEDVQTDFKSCTGTVPSQEETCIGTEPCKKTCSKRSDHIEASPDEDKLNKFIDLGIINYYENKNEDNNAGDGDSSIDISDNLNLENDIQNIIHNLIFHNGKTCNKNKIRSMNNIEGKKFTTPKPGTIVKDTVSNNDAVLLEIPMEKNSIISNLSDNAFRESGDSVPLQIDTNREKIYTGDEAAKKIDIMAHPVITTTPESDDDDDDDDDD
ncbi:A disintegrin and metalloproteinase with thrombospondin motifs 6-like [Aphidius gifuensis]|uniref:A disintegrin and metalloproteinase with thrombospondin motifs 6-like n=1 Tax=Aphidius gifuensis TaxID=684658 RepID=UPI001CDD681A|nr:A disintegrin and metalloproteinase with thrombospondin motifs 6-like [Aphidius gifuensis]